MTQAKTEYHLNQNQLHILRLLFKFRFVTVPLLATYKYRTSTSIRRALTILLEEHYIAKKYDRTYKLLHQPASYYLADKGIATLRQDARIHPTTLHAFYKNKTASDAFIRHTITTMEVYTILRQVYGDHFEMFTKQEIARFEDFPAIKPDLYLRADSNYFITLAHDLPLFVVRRQLLAYITHLDEEGWVSGKYPALFFVFADSSSERRFLAFARTTLDDAGIGSDELIVGTTTLPALRGIPTTTAIWSLTGETNMRQSLVTQ